MWNSYTIAGWDGRCRAGGGGGWGSRRGRFGRRGAVGVSWALLVVKLTSAGCIPCYLVRFGAIWCYWIEWFGSIDVLERNKKWLSC